mmetsp:Transcript_5873/g.13665  ORF Transcript_5873/g.13665 Transcript_5873/m.13665 type:complete len:242 (-) Transcript_5873:21-746(-)
MSLATWPTAARVLSRSGPREATVQLGGHGGARWPLGRAPCPPRTLCLAGEGRGRRRGVRRAGTRAHVGSHEHRAVGGELLADDVRDEHDALVIEVDALDGRKRLGARGNGGLDSGHQRLKELVGQAEANHRRSLDGLLQRWLGDHVRCELGSLEVLDVLVGLVDDLGERLAVDHLLVHVHGHRGVKLGLLERIPAQDAHERRAKVARADHGDLLLASGGVHARGMARNSGNLAMHRSENRG